MSDFQKNCVCPVCKAPVGVDCRNLKGRRIPPHRVRGKAALRIACAVLRPFCQFPKPNPVTRECTDRHNWSD
jgi:hypothetical protein